MLQVIDIWGYLIYQGEDFTDKTKTSFATRFLMMSFADLIATKTVSDRVMGGNHYIVLYD